MPKFAARADANQAEIVDAFRDLGASVQHLHMVGMGCPDILVGFHGVNYLVEIKDGNKSPSKQALTPPEKVFHDAWRGQVAIISSVNQAMNLLGHVKVRGQVS